MSDGFLQELCRPRPDPGGGAAAAFGARVGVALLLKVAQLEELRASGCRQAAEAWPQRRQAGEALEETLAQLQEEDVRAYAALAATFRRGGEAWEEVALQATRIPYRIAAAAREGVSLATAVGGHCARHLLADVQVAVELLAGSGRGAVAIAGANLPWLTPAASREWARRLEEMVQEIDAVLAQARGVLGDRVTGRQA